MPVNPYSHSFLKDFGITRVGDLTSLDTIGVPVWFASRPNSRALSVSQGKGVCDEQAKMSAIMEAVESAVAEQARQHISTFATIEDMARRGEHIVPLENLARVNNDYLDPTYQRAWVCGKSLISNAERYAPYELIGMDMRSNIPWDRQAFRMTSQGLAAHFCTDKAIEHALLELVEYDATCLVDTFGFQTASMREITGFEGADEDLDLVLKKVRDAGLDVQIMQLPSRAQIPVVAAIISRRINSDAGTVLRRPAGMACRLDVNQAVLAALLEALQSRLTDIAGARDDLEPQRYQKLRVDSCKDMQRTVSMQELQVEYALPDATPQPAWQEILNRMRTSGIEDVFVFELKSVVSEVRVVRAIACGLDAHSDGLGTLSIDSILFNANQMCEAC